VILRSPPIIVYRLRASNPREKRESTERTAVNLIGFVNGMKAVLYARVNTTEHDQNPETQLRILRSFADEEVWLADPNETLEFVDHASGGDLNRPAWKEMMKQVRRGSIKAVAVTDIDRAFRSVLDGSSILDPR
jgi:predicted site-specific integrase-resolvase